MHRLAWDIYRLDTGAWAFQETILSPRLFHYGATELIWKFYTEHFKPVWPTTLFFSTRRAWTYSVYPFWLTKKPEGKRAQTAKQQVDRTSAVLQWEGVDNLERPLACFWNCGSTFATWIWQVWHANPTFPRSGHRASGSSVPPVALWICVSIFPRLLVLGGGGDSKPAVDLMRMPCWACQAIMAPKCKRRWRNEKPRACIPSEFTCPYCPEPQRTLFFCTIFAHLG
jgi:hypothetical protein